jgi:hypothetical protein
MPTTTEQIIYASRRFGREVAKEFPPRMQARVELLAMSAMISGINLAAEYLISNDGHALATPQNLQASAHEAANRCGMRTAKIEPSPE